MASSPFCWHTKPFDIVNTPLAAYAQAKSICHELLDATAYAARILSSKLDDTIITLAKSGQCYSALRTALS